LPHPPTDVAVAKRASEPVLSPEVPGILLKLVQRETGRQVRASDNQFAHHFRNPSRLRATLSSSNWLPPEPTSAMRTIAGARLWRQHVLVLPARRADRLPRTVMVRGGCHHLKGPQQSLVYVRGAISFRTVAGRAPGANCANQMHTGNDPGPRKRRQQVQAVDAGELFEHGGPQPGPLASSVQGVCLRMERVDFEWRLPNQAAFGAGNLR